MGDWFTPGIILTMLGNLATIAFLWGKMNANMANMGEHMGKISDDLHEMRRSVVELGKLAVTLSAKVESHEKQLDRISGASRLP